VLKWLTTPRIAMSLVRTSGLVFVYGFWIALSFGSPCDGFSTDGTDRSGAEALSEAASSPGHPSASASKKPERTAPQKAYDLLEQLQQRQGEPLPGYAGGREFRNRERRLPKGFYREYDVNPRTRGRPRDAERIVIEQNTGKAYYTRDHYRTFVALN
jgi:ribonuclease T1